MTFRELWSIVPKVKLFALIIFTIIAGFDGVVMAQVISSVTKFSPNSTPKDIFSLLIFGLSSYLVVQIANTLSLFINNNIIKHLNIIWNSVNILDTFWEENLKASALRLLDPFYDQFSVLYRRLVI